MPQTDSVSVVIHEARRLSQKRITRLERENKTLRAELVVLKIAVIRNNNPLGDPRFQCLICRAFNVVRRMRHSDWCPLAGDAEVSCAGSR